MTREEMYRRLRAHRGPWDVLIIGGGATGAGIALDAASRGYSTLLLEQSDFGKGTSSRSTKLIHGGVRYLEQGNLRLVMEALHERGLLLQNAPHLVGNLGFVVPAYDWWESPFYGAGLKLYNLLAGRYGFGPSRILSRDETLALLPTIRTEGLRGGVIYYDGQFDDTRLLIELLATAFQHGATLFNYAPVTAATRDAVHFHDVETGEQFEVSARLVINATGPFSDGIRRLADPDAEPIIAPSQGVHLVFDSSFLPTGHAIMVPHTSDGRVLFAIPWLGHTLVGTTDTPVDRATVEPVAFEREIDFILSTAALYLAKEPSRNDILSVFAGIRPLVRSGAARGSVLPRDHTIRVESSGIVTVAGGKWTTYRRMAEDALNRTAPTAGLPDRPCRTRELPIRAPAPPPDFDGAILHAAAHEMARTVEDVLARRKRTLFLNARAAMEAAPRAAQLLAEALGRGAAWQRSEIDSFRSLAQHYLP